MRTKIVIGVVVVTAFFIGMCVRSYGVIGHTQNGGFVVTTPWFNGGVEIWGTPGFFNCNNTDC